MAPRVRLREPWTRHVRRRTVRRVTRLAAVGGLARLLVSIGGAAVLIAVLKGLKVLK